MVPGHRRANLEAERGAYVAGAAEGDGEGVGAVDAQDHHNEIDEEAHQHVGGEEGKEPQLVLIGGGDTIDAHGQDGAGVQDAAYLIAHHLPQHDKTNAFEAAAGGAGAAADEHAHGEDDPREMRPLPRIVVEDTGGGEEGDDLEEAGAQGAVDAIVAGAHEDEHNQRCTHENGAAVELELRVLQELAEAILEDGEVEQGEAGAAQEHEEDGGVVDGHAVEVARAGIMGGEASGGGDGHRVVDAVEEVHAFEVEADGADDGEEGVDAPDPVALCAQSGVHLDAHGACGLGREHLDATADERRDDGDGEEDDPQAADPLREAAPEEQGVGQAFYVVDERCAGGGEAGDGLEVGIGDGRDIAAEVEGEAAEEAEDDPHERHDEEGVAA